MDNILRQVNLDEEIVLRREENYKNIKKENFMEVFHALHKEGKIRSSYADTLWVCWSDVRTYEIDYSFDELSYHRCAYKTFNIPYAQMIDILKCFVLYNCGEYIFRSVEYRIRIVKSFLEQFGNADYRVLEDDRLKLLEFLNFLGLSEMQIADILGRIHAEKRIRPRKRTLSHLVNYLAIDSEITDIYAAENISNEEFQKWFPIFFWCKVTFILPLRATEMIVTPFECIRRDNGKVFLTVRRSRLKGARKNKVLYDVDEDFERFEYQIPDDHTVHTIEKYIDMTRDHLRRFLFDYKDIHVHNLFSLPTFNRLLAAFTNERLVGNAKYDYVRYASGIKEFEAVTAGDSRPIAMSNLYYQDAGADICRQLANHMNIRTSAGYYTNVSNTVLASSIMRMQRQINHEYRVLDKQQDYYNKTTVVETVSSCISPRRPLETGDIADCEAENHIEDCLGCRYYTPNRQELKEALKERKEKLDVASKQVLKGMAKGADDASIDFDKLFLDAHTGIVRYKIACDEEAKGRAKKWQRHKNTMKTSS